MKVTHYYTSGPVDGLVKQSAVWCRNTKDVGHVPLIYLQRPKWITDDDAWRKIVASVQLRLPKGFDVK